MAKDIKDTSTQELPAVPKSHFILVNIGTGKFFVENDKDTEVETEADAWDDLEEAKAVRNSINEAIGGVEYIVQVG